MMVIKTVRLLVTTPAGINDELPMVYS